MPVDSGHAAGEDGRHRSPILPTWLATHAFLRRRRARRQSVARAGLARARLGAQLLGYLFDFDRKPRQREPQSVLKNPDQA